jgi:hypothetical protein
MAMHRTVGTFAAAFKGAQRSFKDEKRRQSCSCSAANLDSAPRMQMMQQQLDVGGDSVEGRGSRDRGLKSEKKRAISTFI